jgi:hypothetical protein
MKNIELVFNLKSTTFLLLYEEKIELTQMLYIVNW